MTENTFELQDYGHNWDLHNCVDFLGFSYEPLTGDVVLEWTPLPEYAANPWGDLANKRDVAGCDSLGLVCFVWARVTASTPLRMQLVSSP